MKTTNTIRSHKATGPWAWAEKAALRLIREATDRTNHTASAIVVYVALCELASNEQSEVFTTTHNYIAGLAGVSRSTVQRRLELLEEIGLIHIKTPLLLRGQCTYTLLALRHSDAALRHGTIQPSRRTLEESVEESVEEYHEQPARKMSAAKAWNPRGQKGGKQ